MFSCYLAPSIVKSHVHGNDPRRALPTVRPGRRTVTNPDAARPPTFPSRAPARWGDPATGWRGGRRAGLTRALVRRTTRTSRQRRRRRIRGGGAAGSPPALVAAACDGAAQIDAAAAHAARAAAAADGAAEGAADGAAAPAAAPADGA